LELDRIFPFPASRLKFNWRRSGAAGGEGIRKVVVAAPSEYLGRWEEMVSLAGLSLVAAVPSGWALSAACRWVGEEAAGKTGGLCVILRDLDGAVECTGMDGGETFFSAVRTYPPEAAPEEAFSLLEEALVDAPPSLAEDGVSVLVPSGWCREGRFPHYSGKESLRPVDGFEVRAANAMSGPKGPAEASAVCGVLAACGAALSERSMDLLSPESEGAGFRAATRAVTGALTALTLLLALSWPAAVALRTRQEVNRLDAAIASLRPAVARVEETLSLLGDIEGRITVLREARAGREEPLLILLQLTERLPQGTWLTGLRIEDRKVELEGFSPSANEIFPLLSRDGQFRKVEFASPITRQADNLERFQIRAEFTPSPPPKPGEGGRNP
jgi:Tfp pilus assembly protein PilN